VMAHWVNVSVVIALGPALLLRGASVRTWTVLALGLGAGIAASRLVDAPATSTALIPLAEWPQGWLALLRSTWGSLAHVGFLALAFPASPIPAGFIYIPPGDTLYGVVAEENIRIDFFQTVPLHQRSTPAYAIGKYEVTIADWLEYVAANPGVTAPNIPVAASGPLVIARDGESWRIEMQPGAQRYTAKWGEPIDYKGRAKLAKQDWRRFPITGISPPEAADYAAWLDKTGKVPGARMCSELEWVRAARGADGRGFPTGERIEFEEGNFDATHTRDLMGPDEVGSYPAVESPFGLLDVVGNAMEFVIGDAPGEFVAKGGSYYHDRKTANFANRYVLTADAKDTPLGLRICATVK